jgi:hypothetical protein
MERLIFTNKRKLDRLAVGFVIVCAVMVGMVIGAWLQGAPLDVPSTPRFVVPTQVAEGEA